MKFLFVGLISGVILVLGVIILIKFIPLFRSNDVLLYLVGFILFSVVFFLLGKITNLF
jgi:hypothetical protein